MSEFVVGDKVVVIQNPKSENTNIKVGMTGEVVVVTDVYPPVGIDFGVNVDGHNCEREGISYNCWFVNRDEIVKATDVEGTYSLYKTKWVELMQRTSKEDGTYIYIREPWLIDGKAVSILPFKYDSDGERKLLLRCEKADVPVTGTIKGGCDKEGEAVLETAVRELHEEAGFQVDSSKMIELGTARSSKLNTTIMHLFAVDVTDYEQGEAIGDGTANESNAYCKWVDADEAIESQDPMIHVTIMRLVTKEIKEWEKMNLE